MWNWKNQGNGEKCYNMSQNWGNPTTHKCEFYRQTSSLFDQDCHFHAIYVTLLHINVRFKPHIFQGCIPL